MKRIFPILLLALLALSCTPAKKEITRTQLKDKIAGAWIGQLVGNIYGLEYENKFVDEPGEGPFVFNKAIRKMEAVDGAFSDDDTDVEYLYLLMMEDKGVNPTYEMIRDRWMYHIRDRVWLANRAALGLMHYGFTPPLTGSKQYNPHWFQIDPQLINEIWAYTAPGMPDYAAGISDWVARVTSDDWAASPTVVYGAMYSEAFFENDIPTLVRHAKEYLPKDDRFRAIMDECLDLWQKYPDDWKASRKVIADELYVNEPDITRSIWNADLNGAMGILALLYGDGEIEKTLNIGCALGFDCDNQTATICGLLGVINGVESVPLDRAMPFEHWTKPFNDRYINVTRYDMPDASIEDIIERTVVLAEKNILERGGSVREEDGEKIYTINTKARFVVPVEAASNFEMPQASGRNLAPEAAEILALTRETDRATLDSCWITIPETYRAYTVDVIRDGVVGGPGSAFYSLGEKSNAPKRDYFGYRWDKPITTDMVSFHYGPLEEFGGWYSNMHVEYLDENGEWQPVEATVTPALPFCDEVFFQPHNAEFVFTFPKVTTTAIRVIGDDAILIHWNKYTKDVSSFISVTEVQVYEAQ